MAEHFIESAAQALEAVKELVRREATFFCYPVHEAEMLVGWFIEVTDEGRPVHADDLAGKPSETLNTELMGRVLAARKVLLDEEGKV